MTRASNDSYSLSFSFVRSSLFPIHVDGFFFFELLFYTTGTALAALLLCFLWSISRENNVSTSRFLWRLLWLWQPLCNLVEELSDVDAGLCTGLHEEQTVLIRVPLRFRRLDCSLCCQVGFVSSKRNYQFRVSLPLKLPHPVFRPRKIQKKVNEGMERRNGDK